MIGCHSVMLRPDSVKRVSPPMTIMPKTRAEQPKSQLGSDRGMVGIIVGKLDGMVVGGMVAVADGVAVLKRRKEGVK